MEIDPETGLRSDGAICATERQSRLAGEWLSLQEQMRQLESQKASADKTGNRSESETLATTLSACHSKLTEIERQQHQERQRQNKLHFPDR